MIASDIKELCRRPAGRRRRRRAVPGPVGQDDRGPVWVFSGQGSQWAGMGADLLATEPVFADTVATMEPLIAQESGFSVTEAMSAAETVTGIDRVQPTLFAMQVALASTMESYGVRAGCGHRAFHGRGRCCRRRGSAVDADGVRVICRRSKLLGRLSGSGAMASVELARATASVGTGSRGIDDVVVAVVASPQSTVIGGDTQTIRELVAAWEQREVMAREVAVDVASHSPQVDPILVDLADALADLAQWSRRFPSTRRPSTTRERYRHAIRTTGWTTSVRWSASPRRCRQPSRTAIGSSPSCLRTRC